MPPLPADQMRTLAARSVAARRARAAWLDSLTVDSFTGGAVWLDVELDPDLYGPIPLGVAMRAAGFARRLNNEPAARRLKLGHRLVTVANRPAWKTAVLDWINDPGVPVDEGFPWT